MKDEDYDEEDEHQEQQQQFQDLQDGENYLHSSNAADDEIFQPKYFLNDQRDIEELCEEKCILDKRSMQLINEYNPRATSLGRQQSVIGHTQEAYYRPEFYQGPQFVMYKQLTSQNRKQRIQSSEMGDIQFQNKEKFEQEQQRSFLNPWDRSDSEGSSFGVRTGGLRENAPALRKESGRSGETKEKQKPRREVYGQDFDFKMEKRNENKFWNQQEPSQNKKFKSKLIKETKEGKTAVRAARNSNTKRKAPLLNAKKPKSDAARDRMFDRKDDRFERGGKKRQVYSEYLSEKEIETGLKAGYLFEGIMRVNPNNRKRAFVTVADLKVDVMVDGFI